MVVNNKIGYSVLVYSIDTCFCKAFDEPAGAIDKMCSNP